MKFSTIKNITVIFSFCSFTLCVVYHFASKDLISALNPAIFDKYVGDNVSSFNVSSFNISSFPKWTPNLEPTFGEQLRQFINLSKLTSDDEKEFMEYYSPIMIHRAKEVGEFCKKHPEIAISHTFPYLFIIRRKNQPSISWCCNFKVGSGTWAINFLKESNFNKNNPKILMLPPRRREKARFKQGNGARQDTLYKVFPRPKTQEEFSYVFKNSIRFIVVRHPFTRILSSYRNVIERSIPTLREEPYFQKVRNLIIEKYRTDPSKEPSQFPTFSEFVNYFIDETKGFKTYLDWNSYFQNRGGKGYWLPFWVTCNVCASDFTVVSKLETMNNDQRFMAIIGNLKNTRYGELQEWRHKIENKSSFDLAEDYYKKLSHEQITKLYNIYKYDFKLFNYQIEDYFKLLEPS